MKKLNLTLLVIAIVSFSAKAQVGTSVNDRDQIHFGAKIGLNYANVYDATGEEFTADAKFGMAAGGFIAIPIGTLFGVQPEVLYSQKGFEGEGVILGLNYEFKRTTTYLDIPLYFGIKPTEFITILAGPQFSYLLSKKDVFTSDLVTIEQEEEFENENFRKNILGASIGIDINVNHLVFGARANWDFQENIGDGTSTTPRYKNQWLQATVGFRF